MSKCPYTWFKGLIKKSSPQTTLAQNLRVTVIKNSQTVVDVALPAQSARWLIDLIPDDVVLKIKEEGIPLESIQEDLSKQLELYPQKIFRLAEPKRIVEVWLE